MNPQITEIDRLSLSLFCHHMVRRAHVFYSDPENKKRYQEWKAARDEEAARKEDPS